MSRLLKKRSVRRHHHLQCAHAPDAAWTTDSHGRGLTSAETPRTADDWLSFTQRRPSASVPGSNSPTPASRNNPSHIPLFHFPTTFPNANPARARGERCKLSSGAATHFGLSERISWQYLVLYVQCKWLCFVDFSIEKKSPWHNFSPTFPGKQSAFACQWNRRSWRWAVCLRLRVCVHKISHNVENGLWYSRRTNAYVLRCYGQIDKILWSVDHSPGFFARQVRRQEMTRKTKSQLPH